MGNAGAFVVMADGSAIRECLIDGNTAYSDNMFMTWNVPATVLIEDCEINGTVNLDGFLLVEPGSILRFRNNTFFDADLSISSGSAETDIELEFIDNIFFRSWLIRDPEESIPDRVGFRHNLFWDSHFMGDPEDFFVGGFGNFEADPLFCEDPLTHWLEPESPCIGAGETGENIGARLGVCDVASAPEAPALDFTRNNLHVWPNPSASSIQIVLADDLDAADLDAAIFGIDGRRVATLSHGSQTGPMNWSGEVEGNAAPNGSYIVVLRRDGNVVATERFVLAR